MSIATGLPGGARIILDTHVSRQWCPSCRRDRPAAEFLKTWHLVDGIPRGQFGDTCLTCDPPPRPFPADLRGFHFDDWVRADGTRVTWQQRDHERFGPQLSLTEMGLRQMADGVMRPQPKLVRKKGGRLKPEETSRDLF